MFTITNSLEKSSAWKGAANSLRSRVVGKHGRK